MKVLFKPTANLGYQIYLCNSREDALDLCCSKRAAVCVVLAGCLWGELAVGWPLRLPC